MSYECFGIIYMAKCRMNGKMYIGQTIKTLACRKSQHLYETINADLISKGRGIYFHNAIRKYGIDNFDWTILYENVPEHLLSPTERFSIAAYDSFGEHGYNSTPGGEQVQ